MLPILRKGSSADYLYLAPCQSRLKDICSAHCSLGIAGGRGKCVLFRKGVPFKTVPSQEAEEAFMRELRAMTGQKEE